jgi:uncharacterized protein YdeI (YjbR/CyaY-like superfamily)
MPADFAAALSAAAGSEVFFDKLSNRLERYHVDNINSAKTVETRGRRIAKAVSLFLEGEQR